MREFELLDPLFGADITLLVGGTIADLRKKMGDDSLQEQCPGYYLRQSDAYNAPFYVWVESPQIPLLCHELMHLTFGVLGACGLELSDESEEAYTYWFENVMEQVEKLGLLR